MNVSLFTKKKYPEIERKIRSNFEVVKNGEICLVIGGDGTFIHAAQKTSCPILLIRDNTDDSTGYYSDLGVDRIDEVIHLLKNKNYHVELLGKKLLLTYKNKKYYAINECYLSNSVGEVSFKVYEIINNKRQHIYPFVVGGDGVIISSKIGSTAYNRSAGGPILLENNLFCITFINPDGPYRNALVVNSNKTIEIEISKYEGVLRYDNFTVGTIRKGDSFRVKSSEKEIKIIKLNGIYETFGDKLKRVIKSKMQNA
jgi:NAD+ kinase